MADQAVSYADSDLPVRDDLVEAHQRTWEHIARPGTWWTGAERVAIGAETRNAIGCRLCKKRKDALSPYAVPGSHDSLGELPQAVVDVIHRVATDPGRLTERLLRESAEAGLTDAHYVEAVAVTVYIVNFDVLCSALGLPQRPLPEAVGGNPSRVRPAIARPDGAWVPLIVASEATGEYESLYHGTVAPNIQRAMSLVPAETRLWTSIVSAQYVPPQDLLTPVSRRSITRPQIELLAARVSALNECFY